MAFLSIKTELIQIDVDVFIKILERYGLETNSNRLHFGTDQDL